MPAEEKRLRALAQMLLEAELTAAEGNGGKGGAWESTRGTTASMARSQSLRRLYTPTFTPGRPLQCIAAARVYEEAPVCAECYQVYAKKAAHLQKHPEAVLNVASVPALGLIGVEVRQDFPDY